jgi:hypothetical protein
MTHLLVASLKLKLAMAKTASAIADPIQAVWAGVSDAFDVLRKMAPVLDGLTIFTRSAKHASHLGTAGRLEAPGGRLRHRRAQRQRGHKIGIPPIK